jgi:hypothetical protein
MAGKMFEEFVTRITDSWDKSQADLAYRVKSGTQPEIVMIGTSIEEILAANAFYLVILAVLYFWMSRRENDFKAALKPGMIKLLNGCKPPRICLVVAVISSFTCKAMRGHCKVAIPKLMFIQ